MCVWCCILSVVLLKSDLGERSLLTNCAVLTSPRPVRFVRVEIRSIYWGYIRLCLLCESGEQPSLLWQIINIPYWILDDFDMANLSNLEIVFHPFMTGLSSPTRPTPTPFYLKMKLSTISVL